MTSAALRNSFSQKDTIVERVAEEEEDVSQHHEEEKAEKKQD